MAGTFVRRGVRAVLVVLTVLALSAGIVSAGASRADASLSSRVIGGTRPVSVDVSGSRVVWADRAEGSEVYDIYLFDGVTGVTARLTDGARDDVQPAIDGETVVWVSYSDAGTGADIHAYDIPSRSIRVVCSDPGDQVLPDISGRWVVWEDRSTGYAPSVKAFDLATGERFNVASSQNQPKRRPSVGGDIVVFEDYPRGSASDADVVVYDLASRSQVRRIGDSSAGELRPSTDGRYVAWVRADADGARDVMGLDLSTGSAVAVAEGPGEQGFPTVADGVAYWVENSAEKRLHLRQRSLPSGSVSVLNTFGAGRGAVSAFTADGASAAWIENTADGRQVRAILQARPSASAMLSSLLPSSPAWLPFRLAQVSTAGDVDAPEVVSATVSPGETGVDSDSAFSVTFSKQLDPGTVDETSVTLVDQDGQPVDASVSYSALARGVTIEPDEPLADGTYSIVLSDSIADGSGNTLDEPVVTTFATIANVTDTIAPRVPGQGSARVAAEAGVDAVEIGWAKPLDNVGVTEYLIYAHTEPMTLAMINTRELAPVATVASDPAAPVGAPESAIVSVPGARDTKYTYYYAVRARDAAGNTSALSSNRVADPHGTFVHGANVSTCTMCHGVHGSSGGGTGVMAAGRLAARSAEACFTCHGNTAFATAYGHRSSIDMQARFFSYEEPALPDGGSQHRNDFMVAQQQECDACHSPHRKPYDPDPEDPSLSIPENSYNKLLKRQTGTGLAYNTDAAPFGNEFCFSCHGASMSVIGDIGGMDAYANTAGDHNQAAFDSDSSVAHGSANVFPTRLPGQPGPQISCTACHNEHASPVGRLIDYRGQSDSETTFGQAELCYACHSASGWNTETRSRKRVPEGTGLYYAWNSRDVKAEFARKNSGGSAHPVTAGETALLPKSATWSQSTDVDFGSNAMTGLEVVGSGTAASVRLVGLPGGGYISEGEMISQPIMVQAGGITEWRTLRFNGAVPSGSGLLVDVLDGMTLDPIISGITLAETPYPLIIDPNAHPAIRLRARFSGDGDPSVHPSQVLVWNGSMEGWTGLTGGDRFTTANAPWEIRTGRSDGVSAASSVYARARQSSVSNRYLQKDGLNLSGYGGAVVDFHYVTRNFDGGDELRAEWFDGSSWTTLMSITQNAGSVARGGWAHATYNLDIDRLSTGNRLRFVYTSNDTNSEMYVDEVFVYGIDVGNPSTVTPSLDDWSVSYRYSPGGDGRLLTCYNCHNTHFVKTGGSDAWNMARVSDPANTRNNFTGTSTQFCLRCHGGNVPGREVSASTLVPYAIGFSDPGSTSPYFFGWNKQETGLRFTDSSHFTTGTTKALCENCHDPHASDFNRLVSWTRPSGWAAGNPGVRDNTRSGTLDDVNICYQCHGDGTNGTKQAPGAPNVYTPARQAYAHPISVSQSDADAVHRDTEFPSDLGAGNRHAECVDCHDPHVAKKTSGRSDGLHVPRQSAAGGALVGAWAVKPVWPNQNFAAPTVFEPIRFTGATTDYEAYLCFKCHSGNTDLPTTGGTRGLGSADVAQQFNPANASGHNVLGQVWPKSSFTQGGVTRTMHLPNANSFVNGWTRTSMMTCSDCHTYSGSAARGPHGSSAQFMIDPAYPRPYRQTKLGSESASAPGFHPDSICAKCHRLTSGSGNWYNRTHEKHARGYTDTNRQGTGCATCHVGVPHGWKRPRLIGYRNDPEPYKTPDQYGFTQLQFRTYTSTTDWQEEDCAGAGSGCGKHRSTRTMPTWE